MLRQDVENPRISIYLRVDPFGKEESHLVDCRSRIPLTEKNRILDEDGMLDVPTKISE